MITVLLSVLAAQPVGIAGFDFSLYRPGIDHELAASGATPYADLFGTARRPLWGGHVGALVPLGDHVAVTAALGLSFFSVDAKAFVDDGTASAPSSGAVRSGGDTSLAVMPWSLMFGARYTGLVKRTRFPIAPYAELGPAYATWSVSRGDGATTASGGTFGLGFGAGLLVELAALDRRAAAELAELGVRGVAIRAGVVHLALDGLGADGVLRLSDTTWSAGLELAF
ncbi:MXAN_2562 family outer membrane beta-barrel protein [Myxococcota bacterium]|nr:MXAN_2562 family outer membrane beta-barrel protein [Myxococcota bacterium]